MTPETQAQSKTLEQIAQSIARRGLPFSAFTNSVEYKSALNFITTEVLSALRNERERAAKMVQDLTRKQSFVASIWSGAEATKRELEMLAKAIREGR